MPYKKLIILSTIVFVLCQGVLRYKSRRLVERTNRQSVYREYDLRGDQVELFRKRSEREFFKVKGGFADSVSMPGLASLDFSVTWLRILASVYEDVTVEGDFSWLFHKLRFISYMLPTNEAAFQTALLPMFVVLGKDPAGALFLINEKLTKFKTDWRISYWAGFHALENLNEKKMAGQLFLEAARYPGAPHYLSALGVRLSQGDVEIEFSKLRKFAVENLDSEILEKLKKIRPEWFVRDK
jgi:hypothetical protein